MMRRPEWQSGGSQDVFDQRQVPFDIGQGEPEANRIHISYLNFAHKRD